MKKTYSMVGNCQVPIIPDVRSLVVPRYTAWVFKLKRMQTKNLMGFLKSISFCYTKRKKKKKSLHFEAKVWVFTPFSMERFLFNNYLWGLEMWLSGIELA